VGVGVRCSWRVSKSARFRTFNARRVVVQNTKNRMKNFYQDDCGIVFRIFDPLENKYCCSGRGMFAKNGRSVWNSRAAVRVALSHMPKDIKSRLVIKEFALTEATCKIKNRRGLDYCINLARAFGFASPRSETLDDELVIGVSGEACEYLNKHSHADGVAFSLVNDMLVFSHAVP
jgi:hypothetical protein